LMKAMQTLCLVFWCLSAHDAVSQEAKTNAGKALLSLKATQAKDHIDANATVTGTIAEVNRTDRIVRLNFDQPFPKQPFTAVIFASHTNEFGEVEKLKGKTVAVSGKITEYRQRPQIVLNSTNQLKALESTSSPAHSAEK